MITLGGKRGRSSKVATPTDCILLAARNYHMRQSFSSNKIVRFIKEMDVCDRCCGTLYLWNLVTKRLSTYPNLKSQDKLRTLSRSGSVHELSELLITYTSDAFTPLKSPLEFRNPAII